MIKIGELSISHSYSAKADFTPLLLALCFGLFFGDRQNGNARSTVATTAAGATARLVPDGANLRVRVDTPGGPEFVGIRIPAELSKLNIEIKQKYSFKVRFQDGGIAIATGVNRL